MMQEELVETKTLVVELRGTCETHRGHADPSKLDVRARLRWAK